MLRPGWSLVSQRYARSGRKLQASETTSRWSVPPLEGVTVEESGFISGLQIDSFIGFGPDGMTGTFTLGDVRVEPDTLTIIAKNGAQPIEARVMDVLLLLVREAPRTVSPEEMLDVVWGGVFVSDNSVHRAIATLRKALGDDAKAPRYIQTVTKRGYRLLEAAITADSADVRAGSVAHSQVERLDLREPAAEQGVRDHGPVSAEGAEASFSSPGVAVLPFRIRSQDEGDAILAEAITEDVIDRLQAFRSLPITAAHSVFALNTDDADLKEIARKLSVSYLVTGTVRRAGRRLRVATELIAAEEQHVIWSARFDRTMSDVFLIQDEISSLVAAHVEPEVERVEAHRSALATPEDLDDWRLVRRGRHHQHRHTREDAALARQCYETVLARNPDHVDALINMAWWEFWNLSTQHGERGVWSRLEAAAQRVLAIDPSHASALTLVGVAVMMGGNPAASTAFYERAIKINRSLAIAHSHLGSARYLSGDPEGGAASLKLALRLNPFDFWAFHAHNELAACHFWMGEWDEALYSNAQSLSLRRNYWYGHLIRVVTLARCGRVDEAVAALADYESRRPPLTMQDIDWLAFADPAQNQYLVESLELANWSGGAQAPST